MKGLLKIFVLFRYKLTQVCVYDGVSHAQLSIFHIFCQVFFVNFLIAILKVAVRFSRF